MAQMVSKGKRIGQVWLNYYNVNLPNFLTFFMEEKYKILLFPIFCIYYNGYRTIVHKVDFHIGTKYTRTYFFS